MKSSNIIVRNYFKNLIIAIIIVTITTTLKSCKSDGKERKEEYETLLIQHKQLLAENEIRNLAYQFSDAANRKDGQAFQELWAKNGVWKIGPPINMEFKGKENMGKSVEKMLGMWDFFVQMPSASVITMDGDKATARFYVNEIARKTSDKSGNYNLSMYADELIKEDGKWVFVKRTYNTIYQDAPTYKGLVQALPK
jgi:ketosteroid isomerase-like protein